MRELATWVPIRLLPNKPMGYVGIRPDIRIGLTAIMMMIRLLGTAIMMIGLTARETGSNPMGYL